ncbi:hypothetical protein Gohar_005199, partial [Gossypium harknessii]|nr:hypothetical protein [Gossypium harknessii]
VFKKIENWSENINVNVRLTWFSCQGVLIHSWNVQTLKNRAERYGRFIGMDKKTIHFKFFVHGVSFKFDERIKLKSGDVVH